MTSLFSPGVLTPLATAFLAAFPAIFLGFLIGFFTRKAFASKRIAKAEERAQAILNESRSKAQDILLESKNRAIKLLEDAKEDERERNAQLARIENLLTRREHDIEKDSKELDAEKKGLRSKAEEVASIRKELDANREKQLKELEHIAGLSTEQAKGQMFKELETEYEDEFRQKLLKLEERGREEFDRRTAEILTLAIQRYAGSHIADATTTVVGLPSDELKGKIIGKEGRNIKTIERLTGVDIIIDDTPETLIISGFDPVRRQVAKLTLEKLIADGRIHPARIEETVEKARNELNDKIRQAGEAAIFETGIGMLDPKLVFLLGRLAFRTSFGQNVLLHSIEMTHVAGMLAAEIGADVSVSKKGALLHDIGKAVDHEVQGTHVEIGRKILQKFKVDERVIRAMEAHHEEYPYSSLESRIVQTADAISAARPGARRDTVEIHLKRLEDLETIASSFDGVEKAYAIQAGRELRVFVTPAKIDDLSALQLARDIAKRIESELQYPGEIKVVVIRETRALEHAR